MRRAVAALVLLGLATTARGAIAQSREPTAGPRNAGTVARERTDPTSTAVSQPRCTARVRSVAPQRAGLDRRVGPAYVATDGGALLVWRADDATLFLTRLDASLERRADDRELARPAGPFAMTATTNGAVIAHVERSAAGDDAVLLARVNAAGEARNVPRELGRARSIDTISIVPTPVGFAVAWSTQDPGNSGTHVCITDSRGVPIVPDHIVTSGTQPRLAYLASSQIVVIATTTAPGDASIAVLEMNGSLRESAAWPASARVLATGSTGSGALAIATGTDANGIATPMLLRFAPTVGVTSSPLAFRIPNGTSVEALLGERGGPVVLLAEAGRRETLSRIASDGTLTLLAVRAGQRGTIVPTSDGFVLAGLQSEQASTHGIDVVNLDCPRPPPSAPPVTTAANVTATSTVAPANASSAPPSSTASATVPSASP